MSTYTPGAPAQCKCQRPTATVNGGAGSTLIKSVPACKLATAHTARRGSASMMRLFGEIAYLLRNAWNGYAAVTFYKKGTTTQIRIIITTTEDLSRDDLVGMLQQLATCAESVIK